MGEPRIFLLPRIWVAGKRQLSLALQGLYTETALRAYTERLRLHGGAQKFFGGGAERLGGGEGRVAEFRVTGWRMRVLAELLPDGFCVSKM